MGFISVKNLTTRYNTSKGLVHAIEDVNFAIVKGESIGIAGESACGKSTLGLSIIRMITNGKIYSGQINFNGESLLEIPNSDFDKNIRWKEISMVFQGAMNSLDPVFSIKEQFNEVLKQHDFEDDSEKIILESLASVNLNESILKKFPHELSGGMKQRVVIAMALILKPKFVIADEPTTALDVLIQAQIVNLFKKLKKDGQSFMIISHDLAVLSEVAEKIGIMYGGRMVEFGDSSEIFLEPKHPYTKGLISSRPHIKVDENKVQRLSEIPGNVPNLNQRPTGCSFHPRCKWVFDPCKTQKPVSKHLSQNFKYSCHLDPGTI